jgi:acyl-homoserine lactone acylase PvdQ|tara:strand:- start:142 stop:870 length:729 start_codon:yes stop_codon:yes gene_type:complete
MAGPLTTSERQQRTANLVSVANLAVNYKSLKKLDEVKHAIQQGHQLTQETNKLLQTQNVMHHEALAVADEQLKEMKLKKAQDEKHRLEDKLKEQKKEQEEMQVKMQRDAFFHLNKEIEELNNSSQSNLEKYFFVYGIDSSLKKHNINTDLTQNFEEKKLIDDCLSSVEKLIKQCTDNLTEQDTNDLKTIFDIMSVNEEEEIQNLKLASKRFREIEKELQELKKESNLSSIVKKYSKIVNKVK